MRALLALPVLLFVPVLLSAPAAHGAAVLHDAPAGVAALPADKAVERERLFRFLAAAPNEAQGRAMEDEVWHFWLSLAPNPEVRALVDKAMERRESYDLRGAEELLDQAITKAPDFAEAWNQRAFIRFLRENYEGAESDIHRTLELEPKHFGALSGLFHVLFRQGRTEAANAALAQAVRIHPWLKERTMLPPDPAATRPPIKGKEQDL